MGRLYRRYRHDVARRPRIRFYWGMRTIGLFAFAFLIGCGGGGDDFCNGDDCVCPPGDTCAIDCDAGGNCDVQAQPNSTIDVDCGASATCDVECSTATSCDVACHDGDCDVTCPDGDCTVTGCGETCDVTCGLTGLPTRTGETATCD
jgi:hypothetical protein